MYPVLFHLPLYFVMWFCAAGFGIGIGIVDARRAGFPTRRSLAALALAAVIVACGSKLLYLLETRFLPLDDYVPLEARGMLHGFRIPGGILLLGVTLPLLCRALALPWRRFGDAGAVALAGALVFVRLGCFLNGCCFGRVSSLPWAITFPPQSWVLWYQRTQGLIGPTAERSLPVHPLQLYFLVAAAATMGLLLWFRGKLREGSEQLLFYLLFFGTTALLEPLRANALTANQWLAPIAAASAAALLTRELRQARRPVANGGFVRTSMLMQALRARVYAGPYGSSDHRGAAGEDNPRER